MQVNLYPTARTFPFDKTCSEIVQVLENRNWNIPNIEVKFYEYSGYRMISSITGLDFKLVFCRIQGSLGNDCNNIAAVADITVMDTGISVYSDGCGPLMQLYVGNDLTKDMQWWLQRWDILPLLYNVPRRTINYRGSSRKCGNYFQNYGNIYLVANNDLGRSYSPEPLCEGKILHRAHEWSINNDLTNDAPRCVLVSKVFDWINEELKKRLNLMRG